VRVPDSAPARCRKGPPRPGVKRILSFIHYLCPQKLVEVAMGLTAQIASAVRRHPWTITQDALALTLVMMGGVLLSLQYDLVEFWEDFTSSQRRIRVEEAFMLTLLLAGGLTVFMVRRFKEARLDFEREARAEAANALALLDSLTELPNRRALEAALEQALRTPPKSGAMHAFYLLDLNGFKQVNDEHGHAAGDEVLRVVAKRFRTAARKEDMVARLGGDEFAILARDVDGMEKANQIGGRFINALSDDIAFAGESLRVGVAIGVALYPEHGATPQEISNHADQAMYRAKALRRSNVKFYEAA
jgi:diguanylate cyclase (GGDEF)-like protein